MAEVQLSEKALRRREREARKNARARERVERAIARDRARWQRKKIRREAVGNIILTEALVQMQDALERGGVDTAEYKIATALNNLGNRFLGIR